MWLSNLRSSAMSPFDRTHYMTSYIAFVKKRLYRYRFLNVANCLIKVAIFPTPRVFGSLWAPLNIQQ